ncbi:putative nuclease HARBI1 [Gigantopelta aegis]|uniref:putative nuclease HARBI1 n=1 Tax=Gigantopelta aegis TaxID=1735272 RepID=UPI001B88E46F|nr:putative nuclease HARBI1 [Gigantopelta aegis]
MGDEMTAEDKLMLMRCQLQLQKAQVENAIVIAKTKLRQRDREVVKKVVSTPLNRRKKRTIWVRKWLARRPDLGQYAWLMDELKKEDAKGFCNFLRMGCQIYQEILTRIEHRIKPKKSKYRKPLTAGIKLAITLRYLASGDSYHSLMYAFRVAHNTISKVIRQVCDAILVEFADEPIPCPEMPDEWKNIAKHFGDRWQLHNCVGALDGKHIAIQCPRRGGSLYYNYKGYHTIILMALVDADYKFIWAEVGSNGSAGDAQVFNNSELKEAIDKGVLGLPDPEPLPNDDKPMLFYISADDAFALNKWL